MSEKIDMPLWLLVDCCSDVTVISQKFEYKVEIEPGHHADGFYEKGNDIPHDDVIVLGAVRTCERS